MYFCGIFNFGKTENSLESVTISKLNLARSYKCEIKISRRGSRRIWSFHVVLQRTAKKCTKIYNARAQPLF